MTASFRLGENISYKDKNSSPQTGTIKQIIAWPPSFAYWVKGNPYKWVLEESIDGYEDRRRAKSIEQ
jgi:hypothetical protein